MYQDISLIVLTAVDTKGLNIFFFILYYELLFNIQMLV